MNYSAFVVGLGVLGGAVGWFVAESTTGPVSPLSGIAREDEAANEEPALAREQPAPVFEEKAPGLAELLSREHPPLRRRGEGAIHGTLTDRQGGSLRATLAKTGGAMTRTARASRVFASELWLGDFSAYAGMQGRAERIRTRLQDLVAGNGPVAVYGAPAKATTLLNFCGFTSTDLVVCADSTPAKQGRHIPGTAIPIVDPADVYGDVGAWLLAAHNYARDIICAHPGRRFIVPIPTPVLL